MSITNRSAHLQVLLTIQECEQKLREISSLAWQDAELARAIDIAASGIEGLFEQAWPTPQNTPEAKQLKAADALLDRIMNTRADQPLPDDIRAILDDRQIPF